MIHRENLPGISLRDTGCSGRVPKAGSADGCQHPPRTVTPGHSNPKPWELGCAVRGAPGPGEARGGRAELQLCSIGQSRRVSFPNTSFSPLLMCERPTRGEADSPGRGTVKRCPGKTSREDFQVISILEGWQKQGGKLGRAKFRRGAWSDKGVAHSSALVTHVKISRFPSVNKEDNNISFGGRLKIRKIPVRDLADEQKAGLKNKRRCSVRRGAAQ